MAEGAGLPLGDAVAVSEGPRPGHVERRRSDDVYLFDRRGRRGWKGENGKTMKTVLILGGTMEGRTLAENLERTSAPD